MEIIRLGAERWSDWMGVETKMSGLGSLQPGQEEVGEVEEVGEGGLMEDISTASLLSALHQCSANRCTVESILTAATASCFIATSPILQKLFTVHPNKVPS